MSVEKALEDHIGTCKRCDVAAFCKEAQAIWDAGIAKAMCAYEPPAETKGKA